MTDYTAKPAHPRKSENSMPDYTTVENHGHVLANCPVCGSPPTLQKKVDGDRIVSWAVCCSNNEPIGPQNEMAGFINEGCLLYLPPHDFEQSRRKDAVFYWNEYAHALELLRNGGEDE